MTTATRTPFEAFLSDIAALHINDTYSTHKEADVPALLITFGQADARAEASRLLRLVLHDDQEFAVHGYYEHAEETARYAEQLLTDTPRKLYPADEQRQGAARRLFLLLRAAVLDKSVAAEILREARRLEMLL